MYKSDQTGLGLLLNKAGINREPVTSQQKVGILGVLLCATLAVLILQYDVLWALIPVVLFVLLALAITWPEVGTLVVMFVIFTDIAVIAKNLYGVPEPIASSFGLLLGLPLISYLIIRREKLIIDQTFVLMLFFLATLGASSLFAVNVNVAIDWIRNYLMEGLVLYVLVVNVVRRFDTMKRVIWVLMLAGGLLGSLTLYQELTLTYDNEFYGLAQRTRVDVASGEVIEEGGQTRVAVNRAGGPLSSPNRYAQNMLLLLPLALSMVLGKRSLSQRIIAGSACLLILSGVLLTYSRGGFIGLVLVLLVMILVRFIRPRHVLASVAVVILLVSLAVPGYLYRIGTLRGVEGLISRDSEEQPDYVTRSRATEMLAALNVFLDHPVLGVGPGQYSKFYSIDYHLENENAFRYIPKTRRSHTLYFEMGAETGVIGLGTFLAIALLTLFRLWQARLRWIQTRPDIANVATAFLLSIIAYLGTAVFLHLSYQRFYWFLLALANAAIQISNSEIANQDQEEEAPAKNTSPLRQTVS